MINIIVHGGMIAGKRHYYESLENNKFIIEYRKKEYIEEYLPMGFSIVEHEFKLSNNVIADSQIQNELICMRTNAGAVLDYDLLLKHILPGSDGLIFMFRLQNTSIYGRDQWEHFEKVAPHYIGPLIDYPIVFCYNFYDFLEDKRLKKTCFLPEELDTIVNTYHFPWFATSCKTGKNIKESFLKLLELIQDRRYKR